MCVVCVYVKWTRTVGLEYGRRQTRSETRRREDELGGNCKQRRGRGNVGKGDCGDRLALRTRT